MRFRILFAAVASIGACAAATAAPIPDAPAGNHAAVVVDIDGTLTPSVYAISEARPDAARALTSYATQGVTIIYLSARISFLQGEIPEWLKAEGFPAGEIHLAQTRADHKAPDAFKSRVLRDYEAHGWSIIAAYGDSQTDFKAYAEAGIPSDHVFALLRRGEAHCQTGQWATCLRGWTEQLEFIERNLK